MKARTFGPGSKFVPNLFEMGPNTLHTILNLRLLTLFLSDSLWGVWGIYEKKFTPVTSWNHKQSDHGTDMFSIG